MTSKSRYLLLAAGVVFFLIAAPLIVMYVVGMKYDFAAGEFVRTGILASKLNPKDAQIYINGKLARDNSGSVKFLTPGEYDVTVKKSGYFDWEKRLEIKEDQVTWINTLTSQLNLIPADPPNLVLSSNAVDVVLVGDNLYYLTPTGLNIENLSTHNNQNFPLPEPASSVAVSPDGSAVALPTASGGLLVFSTNGQTFKDVSSLAGKTANAKLAFSPDNRLLINQNGTLSIFSSDWSTKTALDHNVVTFAAYDNGLYFLQSVTTSTASLKFSDYADINPQLLAEDIPQDTRTDILVTPQKQVFILSGNTLYKVGGNLEKIADGVENYSLDSQSGDLIFNHAGQLDYYDSSAQQLNFITRTALPLSDPQLSTVLGYAFFLKDNKVIAEELDTRDRQNEYTLYSTQQPARLFYSPNAGDLVVWNKDNLVSLQIK